MQECDQHNLAVALAMIAWFHAKNNGHALLLRAFDGSIIIIVKSSVNFSHFLTFVTISDGDVRVRSSTLRSDNEVCHFYNVGSRV